MAYKALYRKYRPHNFGDVVGQDAIIKTLQNIVKEGKIGHAYLFSGPRGTGKTSIAKLFAKTVNCINKKDGLACNECEICKHIDNDVASDIIEIDAASNNGVDEIRDLKDRINLVPSRCEYKVYIIDEVHMLSIGAFNALLKTLEEPPKHVIFILATTEMQKIPLTILSRCQNFNFKKITEEKIEEKIKNIVEKEKIKIDDDSIKEIATLSDGGLRDAIGLLEQLSAFAEKEIAINDVYQISGTISIKEIAILISTLKKSDIASLFSIIENFYQEGKDFVRIAEKLIIFLRDLILHKKAPDYIDKTQKNNVKIYKNIENLLSDDEIYKYIDEVQKTVENMKMAGHPKILFEILFLKLMDVEQERKIINTVNTVNEESKKEEVKKEKKISIPQKEILEEELKAKDIDEEYYRILVNNTLALAEKTFLKEFESRWQQLHTYLINKDLKNCATILLDGRVVAASSDHVIIVYKYDTIIEKSKENENEIKKIIKKMMEREYKVIPLKEDAWLEMREYYVKLKKENKKIEILPEIEKPKKIQEEKQQEKKAKDKEITDAIDIFGEELIEMKG